MLATYMTDRLRPARRHLYGCLRSHTLSDEHLADTANQTNSARSLTASGKLGCLVGALFEHYGLATAGLER
jgi:hypothetical protein